MVRQRSIDATPTVAPPQVGVPQLMGAVVVFAAAIVAGFVLGMARPRRTLPSGLGSRATASPETDAGGA